MRVGRCRTGGLGSHARVADAHDVDLSLLRTDRVVQLLATALLVAVLGLGGLFGYDHLTGNGGSAAAGPASGQHLTPPAGSTPLKQWVAFQNKTCGAMAGELLPAGLALGAAEHAGNTPAEVSALQTLRPVLTKVEQRQNSIPLPTEHRAELAAWLDDFQTNDEAIDDAIANPSRIAEIQAADSTPEQTRMTKTAAAYGMTSCADASAG